MIQIDMPMPTNCFDCPACNEYLICAIPVNGRKWGDNDVHEFCQGRPEWCPMKEQKPVQLIHSAEYEEYWDVQSICPKCNACWISLAEVHFCPQCGQAVKDDA